MMTSSGARGLPQPALKVGTAMMGKPADPKDLFSITAYYVKLFRLIGSPGYPTSEPQMREMIEASLKRGGMSNKGSARQLVAVAADGATRAARLHQLRVPTQVIHGEADPLVPAAHGRDLAQRIAGAQLDLIPGMGHDLPQALWPRFVAGIKKVGTR